MVCKEPLCLRVRVPRDLIDLQSKVKTCGDHFTAEQLAMNRAVALAPDTNYDTAELGHMARATFRPCKYIVSLAGWIKNGTR